MRLLIVDDNADMREFAMFVFRDDLVTQASGLDDMPMGQEFDVVLTDWVMVGHTGAEVAAVCRTRWPDAPVIAWTAVDDHIAAEIEESGVFDAVLRKPCTVEHMREVVRGG